MLLKIHFFFIEKHKFLQLNAFTSLKKSCNIFIFHLKFPSAINPPAFTVLLHLFGDSSLSLWHQHVQLERGSVETRSMPAIDVSKSILATTHITYTLGSFVRKNTGKLSQRRRKWGEQCKMWQAARKIMELLQHLHFSHLAAKQNDETVDKLV